MLVKNIFKEHAFIFLYSTFILFGFFLFTQPVLAQPINTEIKEADTFLDLKNQEVNSLEQFKFILKTNKTSLVFDFPISLNQSSDILNEVSLSEKDADLDVFYLAEKVVDGAQKTSNLTYKTSYSEIDEMLRVEIFYYFQPNQEYILRFKFDHTALLDISDQFAFLKYPIAVPRFANTAQYYAFHCELPYEILPEEYRLQSVAETWFQDETSDLSNLHYLSNNFRYRTDQFIYLSLPSNLFPGQKTNQPDLTQEDFFPNPGTVKVVNNSIQQFSSQPFLVFILFIISIVFLLFIYFIFEKERIIFIEKMKLNRNIFELDAAHSGFLLKSEENANLILAGLIQLVQKNEIELSKTTFHWLHPEREDFSDFSSSEVFLLQWLFTADKKKGKANYSITSAEKIRLQVENDTWSEEFLLNFKKYILLLESDLVKTGYINVKNKKRGRALYLGIAIIDFVLLVLLLLIGRSLFSLSLVLPLIFALFRFFKARFFSVKGRIKWKQMSDFKLALQSVGMYFKSQEKWISNRDLAPLIIAYAMSLSILESYLEQLNYKPEASLGIVDLMDAEFDYTNASPDILAKKWLTAKTDILRMYYLFTASLISSKIQAQKKIIKKKEIDFDNQL